MSGDLFDLRTFFLSIWQHKSLVVASVVAGAVLAGAIAAFQTPKYRSETILAEADSGKSGSGLAALAGQFGNLASLAGVNLGRAAAH